MNRSHFTALATLVAAFLGLVGWEAYTDLDRHRLAVEQRVATGVLALDEQASRVFGEVELAFLRFDITCPVLDAPSASDTEAITRRLADLVGDIPQLAVAALADRNGRVVATTAPWVGASVADRDYLSALRDEGRPRIFIGSTESTAAEEVIPVGLPLADERGLPCGVVLAGVSKAHFLAFYRTFLGADDGVLSLRREDGRFLARVSSNDGKTSGPSVPERGRRAGPEPWPAGVHTVVSPVDGTVRIGAYRKLRHFPLIVRFAVSERAVLTAWYRDTLVTLAPSLVFLVLLIRAWLRISRLLVAGQTRERQLERANAELGEARMAAEAATQARTMFLANMSHEIRTPLNAIVGFGHLLRNRLSGDPERTYVAKLQGACDTVLRLISGILDLSKAEAGQIVLETRPFDLLALLRDQHDLAAVKAGAKGVPLRLDIGPGLDRWVVGDSLRVSQVLANLVDNAVKFTAAGEVVVAAARVAAPEGRGAVRFSVRDTGIGLSADQIEGLFQPFHQADPSMTRRYGGTGLGLAISQRLLRLMGSEIRADSRPGQGSTFSFELVLPVAAASPEVPAPGNSLAGWCILLVDDDALGREVTSDLLRLQGAQVLTAADGRDGIEMCLSGAAIDLVLMDLHMPEVDGLEATRRIRASLGPNLPIIGLSANALAGARDQALASGMTDYLVKPVDPQILCGLAAGSTARPPAPQALLNGERLRALRDLYSRDQAAGFIDQFERQLDRDLGLIRHAFEAGDAALLAGTAHRLAGTASHLACERLMEAARRLAHAEVSIARAEMGDGVAELERLAGLSRVALRRAWAAGQPV